MFLAFNPVLEFSTYIVDLLNLFFGFIVKNFFDFESFIKFNSFFV